MPKETKNLTAFDNVVRLAEHSRKVQHPESDVALVMPCYNEALRLDGERIVSFLISHPRIHLVMVNDGSTDATLDILLSMAATLPDRITVLDLARNGGKAEAVRQGLLHGLTLYTPLVAYWDADLATPLEAVEDFARIARRHPEIEVVFGSRRQMLGHRIQRKLGRKIISRACASLARMALGLPVADTQCGAKMLRSGPALRKALETPFTAGWLFDVELFARIGAELEDKSAAFYEFPLSRWDEIPGSKVSGRAVVKAGLRMLRLIAECRLGMGKGVKTQTSKELRVAVTGAEPRVFRGGMLIDVTQLSAG